MLRKDREITDFDEIVSIVAKCDVCWIACTTQTIRKALPKDIAEVTTIYDIARAFMRNSGNPNQWRDNYPSAETLGRDIEEGNSYVVEVDGNIVATFYFKIGEEPTYATIYDGAWLNHGPYGVIHRVASNGRVKGIMSAILDYCLHQIGNIRIDTHRDNQVMQTALLRYGFKYCGIIHLANGDERLAFQFDNRP